MSEFSRPQLNVNKTYKLFIGGEFPRTESGRSFPQKFHNSESLYANLCRSSRKDFRNSVVAAKSAMGNWSSKSAYNRSQILYRMGEMTEGKRLEFVELFRNVLGWSKDQAHQAVDDAIDSFIYYAGFADKYQQLIGAVNPVAGPHHNFTTPEPMGVIGLLCSDNFDFGALTAQISSIICSGNTVVVLLGPNAPAVIGPLAEVFATSDLTKGAVNLLVGDRDELANFFGSHMEVQALSIQCEEPKYLAAARADGIHNMKRVFGPSPKGLGIESIINFVEYKTVWHPIGN